MKTSLFMPTMNRLEFTRLAVEELFKWTDKASVDQFLVVDAGSDDGTAEWLRKILKSAPFPSSMVTVGVRHVVSSMQVAYKCLKSELIAKVDSDTVVCPEWLPTSLQVMGANPELWALGIHGRGFMGGAAPLRFQPSQHVGGIGVFRRKAWTGLKAGGKPYYGWTRHQHNVPWEKGWLSPGLPVFVLNLLRFDPYLAWSEEYIRKGWQRASRPYRNCEAALWDWKFPEWRASLRRSSVETAG